MRTQITASQFYNYVQCPCRVYLDVFGDEEEKVEISEFMRKKMEDGILHEKEIIKDKDFEEIPVASNEEAFKETLKAMKKGSELIYQGVLIKDNLIGKPDLLIRQEGKSKFGDYFYAAADIKSGKRLKHQYVMQVMFYCELLKSVQGKFPEQGKIINIEKEELEFETFEFEGEYKEVLSDIQEIVNGKVESPIYCSNCKECVWQKHCIKELEEKQDISLLYRLGLSVKRKLTPLGINNLSDIRNVDKSKLLAIKGIGEASVKKWKLMAEAIQDNKLIVLKKPILLQKKVEIFFDIEGETSLEVDYLYGCLVRINNKEEFKPFWADKPKDEDKMWAEFCDFIESCDDDIVIYYYTPYEKTSLKKMKEKYGCKDEVFEKIINNMVDLFPIVTNSVVLPLYSYSIKPIAKWLGFKWRDTRQEVLNLCFGILDI